MAALAILACILGLASLVLSIYNTITLKVFILTQRPELVPLEVPSSEVLRGVYGGGVLDKTPADDNLGQQEFVEDDEFEEDGMRETYGI